MKKCILYSHAGSANHGCEALLRTAIQVIQNVESAYSGNVNSDQKYGLAEIVELKNEKSEESETLINEIIYALKYKILKDDKLYFKKIYKPFINDLEKDKIYISIGGDNYCYHFSEWLEVLNTAIVNKGALSVLWGCSINADEFDNDNVLKDLQNYSLITARESLTYQLLKEKLPQSNIKFVPDTAFTLSKILSPLPNGFIKGKTIGLNISPVVLNSAKNSDKLLKSFLLLINYIIDTTDYQIALIPHVVIEGNDDRLALKYLYDNCEYKNRLVLIEDNNCRVLKGFISQCILFIGARTHATIAAYSTCVPTLVIGYSIKSLGIAKDLFGTNENYVLPAQNIKNSNELIEAFEWLNQNKVEISAKLKEKLPEYISKIKLVSKYLEEL